MIPIDNGYNEVFDTFTYREAGAIRIPKIVRERAMSLSIEIEVVSIRREAYRNYKSDPSHGFYGYAVLIFNDYCSRLIPLIQGRQTLYLERHDAAYSMWESYKNTCWLAYNQSLLNEAICSVATELGGVCLDRPCVPIPWSGFKELPLREIYVRCEFGTTFRLEIGREVSRPFQDSCGNLIDPKSVRSDDPRKDNGLPPTGSQPQNAEDPDNPYNGFPPPSTWEEQGDFANNKGWDTENNSSGIDRPNTENEPVDPRIDRPATTTEEGYYIEYPVTFYYFCNPLSYIIRKPSYSGSFIFVQDMAIQNGCGFRSDRITHWVVKSTTDSTRIGTIDVADYTAGFAFAGTIKYGLLPPTTQT